MNNNIIFKVGRYINLEWLFLKMNIIATSKYGVSYFLSIFYELMNGLMNIIYFYIMFGSICMIGLWKREDIFLLVIIGYFIDVVCVMFFIGTASIPEYISTGTLDVLLTKPINHQFLLCFRRPNSVQIINVLLALLLMIKIIFEERPNFISVLLFWVSIILSVILMYLIVSTFVYFSFWTVKVGSAWELIEKFNSVSNKPSTIYPKIFRFFLTFIIPSIVIINFPVEILSFHNYSLLLTRTIPITIAFLVINNIIFKFGIRHYSGAGG